MEIEMKTILYELHLIVGQYLNNENAQLSLVSELYEYVVGNMKNAHDEGHDSGYQTADNEHKPWVGGETDEWGNWK